MKSKINNLNYPRIKIIINKKHIKYSYKRNKIKRIIKESFRLNQHNIKNIDLILLINKNTIYTKKIFLKITKIWKNFYIKNKK